MSSSSARPAPPGSDLVPTPGRRLRTAVDPAAVLVIAAGGVLGAEARYGLSLWQPHRPDQWPFATWWINLGGSFLLGLLMVLLLELTAPHRLLRPFLGVGVLGGFTTFSTAMVDVHQLFLAGRGPTAIGYLIGTAFGALIAVTLGMLLARSTAAAWTRRRSRGGVR